MLSHQASNRTRRQQQHQRQNSTPTMFEATSLRPTPAGVQRRTLHRRGMSMETKPLLPAPPMVERTAIDSEHTNPIAQLRQAAQSVSTTNTGQQQLQHSVQVAQQHRPAQPGPQLSQRPQTPPTDQQSQPSEQQLKELEQHIKQIYGAYGTVYVNILPTPVTTPQKPRQGSPEKLDLAPMPMLEEINEVNLDPPGTHHSSDNGYESSVYASDMLSPGRSPTVSPLQQSFKTTFEDAPHLNFAGGPSLLPASQSMNNFDDYFSSPSPGPFSPHALSITDLNIDATIEDTGISAEEVQAFISEQDPNTHRWCCLFEGCGKTFGRRENIRSHVQTHLGDRQYRCNGCGKCFVRQHDLKRHSKIHTGDKPYKCPCGGGFARQDALTRHRQRGMCSGAFPGIVRKPIRRGRPRKNRTDLEKRVEKSEKTRRALASLIPSAHTSPESDAFSPTGGLDSFDTHHFADLQSLESHSDPITEAYSFETSNSFSEASASIPAPFQADPAMEPLFRWNAETIAQTPPMSPESHGLLSGTDSPSPASVPSPANPSTPSYTPASNPPKSTVLTTPPSSPPNNTENQYCSLQDIQEFPNYEATVAGAGLDMNLFEDAFFRSDDNLIDWRADL